MPAFSYCRWGVIWKQWYDTNFIGNGTYQVSIRLSLDIVGWLLIVGIAWGSLELDLENATSRECKVLCLEA